MTKFAVEKLNPDWTGQGMTMAEVMALNLANAKTVLRKSRESGALTMVGQEESWEVFDYRGQGKKKKWRGYFEKGERKYCTMQRGQTLWTLIGDLGQREMQKMFDNLGGHRVPRQYHKQILSHVAGDKKVLRKIVEETKWDNNRVALESGGCFSYGQIKWRWRVGRGIVELEIFSSWGYAEVSIKIFKDRWGMWDFAVDDYNNKWMGGKDEK